MIMKISVVWNVTPFSWSISLDVLEEPAASIMKLFICNITWYHIPQDSSCFLHWI